MLTNDTEKLQSPSDPFDATVFGADITAIEELIATLNSYIAALNESSADQADDEGDIPAANVAPDFETDAVANESLDTTDDAPITFELIGEPSLFLEAVEAGFISDIDRHGATGESIANAQDAEGPEIDGLRFYTPNNDQVHISEGGTENLNNIGIDNGWDEDRYHFISRDLDDNYVTGHDGVDKIFTHQGDDEVYAGEGEDLVFTGGGRDYILGGSTRDFVDAGSGNDKVDGGGGDDVLYGEGGSDRLYGRSGDDFLHGGGGRDFINGGGGDDRVHGGGGDDVLKGNGGDDRLHGGAGTNVFYGGGGRDVFVVGDKNDSDDTIMDMELGVDRFKFKSDLRDQFNDALENDASISGLDDIATNNASGGITLAFAGREITIEGYTIDDIEDYANDNGYDDWEDVVFIG